MKFNRILLTALLIAFFALLTPVTTPAQEPTLIDETVARVNSDIITRSALIKAQEAYKAELTQRFPNDEAKQKEEYEKNAPTILDLLIEDRLINQRATELGVDVEAEINRYILAVAKQTNPQWTLPEFQEALKAQGIDIEDVRRNFRTEAQRRVILYREVISPIYEKLTPIEKQEWYQAHRTDFQVPGSYALSEIFITTEGRSEAEAEALARQVTQQARAGKPFTELVKVYSDPKRPSTTKNGEYVTVKDNEIADYLRKAVEKLKDGQVSDPIKLDKGFQIIYLNSFKPPAVRDFTEVEADVAQQLSLERGNAKLKEYFKELREKSYIRIAEAYKQPTQAINAKP